MASSNETKNSAFLLNQNRFLWEIKQGLQWIDETCDGLTIPVAELKSISYSEIYVHPKSKREGSEYNWKLLDDIIKSCQEKNDSSGEKCITFYVKELAPKTHSFFVKIHEDLIHQLKLMSSSLLFVVKSRTICQIRSTPNHFDWFECGSPQDVEIKDSLNDKCCSLESLLPSCGWMDYGISILGETNSKHETRLKFTWSVSIEWTTNAIPPTKLVSDDILSKLFACDATKDLTIVVGNGKEVACHKIVFAAHSPVLAAMIAAETGMKEATSGRVEMKEMGQEGMELLVRYFYGLEIPIMTLSCDVALELFQAAHKYDLPELEMAIKELFEQRDSTWFTADSVLEVYFFAGHLENGENLREHCVNVMTRIPYAVMKSERYKELDREEAVKLPWELLMKALGEL